MYSNNILALPNTSEVVNGDNYIWLRCIYINTKVSFIYEALNKNRRLFLNFSVVPRMLVKNHPEANSRQRKSFWANLAVFVSTADEDVILNGHECSDSYFLCTDLVFGWLWAWMSLTTHLLLYLTL